jgi:microcin C transport system substrate-binding protein
VLRRLLLASLISLAPLSAHAWQHALAMHGEPKYGPDFAHFDYVNPDAPKGGQLRLSSIGTYDSLNGFILKGTPATGLGLVYDTLTYQSLDEPFTAYGLLAESMEVAPDHTAVKFRLRKEARFHDGKPVRPEDVVFSFNTLMKQGHPAFRMRWADVASVEKSGARDVTFRFRDGDNRELPLILGQLPVLPEHFWKDRDFSRTTFEVPQGSGPYRIKQVDAGRAITYERVPDYWGKHLAVNRGRHNVDSIRFDYYRDRTVAREAFKGGAFDFWLENVAKDWFTAYDIPAVRSGRIQKVEIPHENPAGMQGFFMNLRRPIFQDPRVRLAMNYAFDFEWTNANIFNGAYTRTESYFANSELAAQGLPSPQELEVLEPLRDRLPPQVFTEAYQPPTTDGNGIARQNLRRASELLKEAGWEIEGSRRVHTKTGRPLSFEILLVNPTFERVVLPYVRNLERLGVQVSVRTVDPTQYQERLKRFDYDMTVDVIGQSLSPGNEQRDYWSCEAAKTEGSGNVAGICEPAVDALIEKVISAPDRESLVARTRALDRALLWGHYVVPHWHNRTWRVAYWNKLERPETPPKYGLPPVTDVWWIKQN